MNIKTFILAMLGYAGIAVAIAAPLADLSGGQTGRIEFTSITAPNRYEYARLNLQNTRPVTVFGDLLMPKNVSGKVPAVVLSHGSGGVEANMYDVWAKELNAAGYAVFIVDSFKPRGIDESNSKPSVVPFPSNVADALNALRLLATHPQIDSTRIFNMGFSLGGETAFYTAWPTWQRPVETNGVKFAAHVVWYPGGCGQRYRTDDQEKATAPIFVLLADRELEESIDVTTCRRWYDELAAKGNAITYKEYKGARHGFDGLNFTYRVNPRTSSNRKCDMEVFMTRERDGTPGKNGMDFKLNRPIKTFQDLTDSVNACAERGTVPGSRGGGNAREVQAESVKDAINFLKSI